MENKNKVYLFAVRYDDENGFRYGLPFPGTVETMKRDIRESLKGFDKDMVKHYSVEALCEYVPTLEQPLVLNGVFALFEVSDILAEGGDVDAAE